jgi:two-component system cell cycle sensor histidine kinase/response regulator CckA
MAQSQMNAERTAVDAVFPLRLGLTPGELRSKRIGVLWARADLSETKRIMQAKVRRRVMMMGAVVLSSMLAVFLYLHFAVSRRLGRILGVIDAVTSENTVARAGFTAQDELGRVGQGLDRMLNDLDKRNSQLRISEERHRSVVQSMNEGVLIFDGEGKILFANEAAVRIGEVAADEYTRRTVTDPRWQVVDMNNKLMSPEQYPAAMALRTGEPQRNIELGVITNTGGRRWLLCNAELTWLDAAREKRGVVTSFTDITARRDAEIRAVQDRERLQAIVGSAMDAVICIDAQHRITLFNGAAEKTFGRRAGEMLGQPLSILIPDRFRSVHERHVAEFKKSGATSRTMGATSSVVGLRANGEEFPIDASISRAAVSGDVVLTVIARDVSERKHAEEERELLEAQLRQSQKMQSLGTLTGGIAHDFNNILTAIAGNVKLAIADLTATHPVQRSLTEIEKATARATDLVRQVLAFGRRQESRRVAVDMAVVVDEALNFLRAMIPATIDIRRGFAHGLPPVAVDATQVHQVITNLGANAAHAIGDRSGVIDVVLKEVNVTSDTARKVSDLHPGRYVRMTFSDNGTGIEPETLERIFEPFFTTKSLGQGTGLGLSVVHGIVKNHDGAITVRSSPGAGTHFDLYFPVSPQSQANAKPDTKRNHTNQTSASGKTIIYVDDEDALVLLVTRMLERRGYKVMGFSQPKNALAELSKNPQRIDALVSDLAMPVMNGFEVAKEALAMRADLPVVLVSGYVRSQDTALAEDLGVRKLMLKPDTVDALVQVLDEVFAAADEPEAS